MILHLQVKAKHFSPHNARCGLLLQVVGYQAVEDDEDVEEDDDRRDLAVIGFEARGNTDLDRDGEDEEDESEGLGDWRKIRIQLLSPLLSLRELDSVTTIQSIQYISSSYPFSAGHVSLHNGLLGCVRRVSIDHTVLGVRSLLSGSDQASFCSPRQSCKRLSPGQAESPPRSPALS